MATHTTKCALSIAERVEAALRLHKMENPASSISIAAICRMAGVNRSNLYSSHPDLVKAIRGPQEQKPKTLQPQRSGPSLVDSHNELLKKHRALLCICIELAAEVQNLKARLNAKQKTRRSRGAS